MASYFKAQEINKVEKQQLPESTVAVYSNITPKNKEEAKKRLKSWKMKFFLQ